MNSFNFNISVSDSDISAISALSDSDRANLVTLINSTDPQLLFDSVEGKEGKQIICPICGSGSGKHHTGATISFENGVWLYHCFACDSFKGDLIKIIAAANHLSTKGNDFFHILAIAVKILNINITTVSETPVTKTINAQMTKSVVKLPATEYPRLTEARNNLAEFVEKHGGKWRGLSLALLQRLNWGFLHNFSHPKSPNFTFPAIIVPNDLNGIFARRVDNKGYSNIEPTATTTIFLPQTNNFDLLIVEGAINGASILQAVPSPTFGIIASGGTSGNSNVLATLQHLRSQGKNFRVIIAYDNDTGNAGQNAAQNLLKTLSKASFTACIVDITKTPDTDLNDLLNANNGTFKLANMVNDAFQFALNKFAQLELAQKKKLLGDNTSDFFSNKFKSFVDENKKFTDRHTGFSNLDDELKCFRPGVYILGGLAALGKTTFALQLLEQMARLGTTCIFVSYEMQSGYLYSKLLAREVARIETNNFQYSIVNPNDELRKFPLNASNISLGNIYQHGNSYTQALNFFAENPLPLYIWELDEVNIDKLLNRIENICSHSDKPPVVCIDYLQLLAGDSDNTKSALDSVLRKIFNFRGKTNTTFIIISSLNRANYNTEISFESFKETGNIEYSADAIWGLQLLLTKRTPDAIESAKNEIPRQIQLKCLKNRFGSNFDIGFFYYPNIDTFIPMLEYGAYTDYTQSDSTPVPDYDDK